MITGFTSFIFITLGMTGVFSLGLKIFHARNFRALSDNQKERLFTLAQKALESLDVPIGALLISEDKIIGEGYNTVLQASDAGGHAEINAISDAIRRIGMDHFSALDRESLFLVTTFEPCIMCTGAFITYNIRNVYYMKNKDFLYRLREGAKFIQYYLTRKTMTDAGEQDALFERHPHYPKRKTSTEPIR